MKHIKKVIAALCLTALVGISAAIPAAAADSGADILKTADMYLTFEDTYADVKGNYDVQVDGDDPEFVEGRFGKAAEIRSGDGSLYVEELAFGADSFTLTSWVNLREHSGDPVLFGNKDWNSGSNPGWLLSVRNGDFKYNANAEGGSRTDTEYPYSVFTSGSELDNWIHIALVVDRAAEKYAFYANGRMIGSITDFSGNGHTDGVYADELLGYTFHIGEDGTGMYNFSQNLVCDVDEIALFRRALTEEEIVAVYTYAPEGAEAATLSEEEDTTKRTTVNYGSPAIDGTVDDIWATADRQQLVYTKAGDLKTDPNVLPDTCSVFASALWDEKGVYFLFEITDDEFAFNADVGHWKNDSIYLFLDEAVSLGNTWTDQQAQIALIPKDGLELIPRNGAALNDYELAYSFPTDNTCVIEFKYVPRGALALEAGSEFAVEYQYNDGNDAGNRDYCLGWADSTDSAASTTLVWGLATLAAKDASAAPAAAADSGADILKTAERDLILPKTEYAQNEDILITASGEGKDWVGVYASGEVPGGPSAIYWYYVAEDAEPGEAVNIREQRSGNRSEYDMLPPGEYTVWFLMNDSYESYDFIDITVKATLQLNTRTYKEGDDVLVTANSDGKDWVGIYPAGETPGGGTGAIYWYYVAEDGHTPMETVRLQGTTSNDRAEYAGLPAGDYTVYLLANDGYDVIDSVDITVIVTKDAADGEKSDNPAPAIAGDNGYVTDGLQIYYDGANNTGEGQDKDSKVWRDVSGNGYDFDVSLDGNNHWTDKSYYIDSTANYFPDKVKDIANGDQYTIELALGEIEQPGTNWISLIISDNDEFSLFVRVENDNLEFKYNDNNGDRPMAEDGAELVNNSTVAVTFDVEDQDCFLYVDGELLYEAVPLYANDANYMHLGSEDAKRNWLGDVYAIRFYDRELTEAEIQQNAKADDIRFRGASATPTVTIIPTDTPSAGIKGYDSVEDAAAAVGMTPIKGYDWEDGTNGFGGEGPDNLWDDDVTTKFCTNEFPAQSVVQLDGIYKVTGFAMATANDNADYNGRSPNAWTISVSSDGQNWTTLASGDDSFFEETNYTYYNGTGSASDVAWVKFEAAGTASGTFQVSEVVLYGEKTGDKPAAEPETEAPAPETEAPAPETEAPAPETEALAPVTEAPAPAETTKSGCGSFIGGGLIVLTAILGSAWVAKRR